MTELNLNEKLKNELNHVQRQIELSENEKDRAQLKFYLEFLIEQLGGSQGRES